GISLLSQMNIPQLSVNVIAETVKTADNQAASLFINYFPATDEDVRGLNPADVKKIEYLDFPVDPRFQHAQHVVNFVTHNYSTGGYTKLYGKERFMTRSGEASVYSKFVYKKMEYDLIIAGDYDYCPHKGSASDERYHFGSGDIIRESTVEASSYRRRGAYSAFRASWNKSEQLSLKNMISFSKTVNPENRNSGSVKFSALFPPSAYYSESTGNSADLEWGCELYAALGRGWSLSGNLQSELIRNKVASTYETGDNYIENNAVESSGRLKGAVQVNKSLSDKVTVFSSITVGADRKIIDYTGTSYASNRFWQAFMGASLGVSLNFNKLAGSVDGGFALESNNINGYVIRDRYPFTHISLQYSPDRKHMAGIWFQYATFSPDASMKNPNVIQQSELMYVSGNKDLKCSRHTSANVSYTWLHSNKWQMMAYGTMFCVALRQIPVYSPDESDGMMLKKYENDGNYYHGQIGGRVTGKFLDGRLAFSVSPRILLYKTTGSYYMHHFPIAASLNIDYYLKKFFFNVYWESATSYVDGEDAYKRSMPAGYSFSAGWASCGWNLQLSIINPFQSSWRVSKDALSTRWYESNITQYGSYYHRRIAFSVSYTINYGKRVNQSGEMNSDKKISSAILK
ncbi:MAG: hypothetical protein K2H98_05160, partial [Duncaniella sp.]|nr:hypothetical protein [Duncaniella sp.]